MDACLEWAFISLPLALRVETFIFQLCKMGEGGKGRFKAAWAFIMQIPDWVKRLGLKS